LVVYCGAVGLVVGVIVVYACEDVEGVVELEYFEGFVYDLLVYFVGEVVC